MDHDTPSTGEGDPYASSSEKYGALELPTALDPKTLDLGSLAPLYGLKSDPGYEPEYMDYNMKGRGLFDQMWYNCGIVYLLGTFAGGAYGAVQGSRLVDWKELWGVVVFVSCLSMHNLPPFSEIRPGRELKFE